MRGDRDDGAMRRRDAARRHSDNVLASGCCAQFGHVLARSGLSPLSDRTVAGLAVQGSIALATKSEHSPFPLPPL